MKAKILGMLVNALMSVLTPELLKDFVDKTLDWVEERVLGSASTVDDAIMIPLCNLVRTAFDVPDDD
jgi:hypothetical protein